MTQVEDSSPVAVIPNNYASIIGHPVSPKPMNVPTVAVIVMLAAAVLIGLVLWLIHLVRKRYFRRFLALWKCY